MLIGTLIVFLEDLGLCCFLALLRYQLRLITGLTINDNEIKDLYSRRDKSPLKELRYILITLIKDKVSLFQ